MNQSENLKRRIDAYLSELRRCLGELPPEEVDEILQEIRGHILERAEASGELTEKRLVAILKSSLAAGAALFVATTRLLRWTLRFARIRRPTQRYASC